MRNFALAEINNPFPVKLRSVPIFFIADHLVIAVLSPVMIPGGSRFRNQVQSAHYERARSIAGRPHSPAAARLRRNGHRSSACGNRSSPKTPTRSWANRGQSACTPNSKS